MRQRQEAEEAFQDAAAKMRSKTAALAARQSELESVLRAGTMRRVVARLRHSSLRRGWTSWVAMVRGQRVDQARRVAMRRISPAAAEQ